MLQAAIDYKKNSKRTVPLVEDGIDIEKAKSYAANKVSFIKRDQVVNETKQKEKEHKDAQTDDINSIIEFALDRGEEPKKKHKKNTIKHLKKYLEKYNADEDDNE